MVTQAEFLAALRDHAVPDTPMPTLVDAIIDEPLPNVFVQVLEQVGGVPGDGATLAAVQTRVDQLIASGAQVLSLVAGISGNCHYRRGDDPHDLQQLDYTVAPARLAVAENAALWLSGDDLSARVAPFICSHLIGVVAQSTLVGTMGEAVALIGELGGHWGTFISGPSKTADIEQALVMGAHGARSMTVYLVNDAVTAATE